MHRFEWIDEEEFLFYEGRKCPNMDCQKGVWLTKKTMACAPTDGAVELRAHCDHCGAQWVESYTLDTFNPVG